MEQRNKLPKFSARMIFGIFMVFFYLLIAILLIFTPIFKDVHVAARIAMGVLFFIYGLFRGYRAWKQL